ncbi:MAG: ATP-binding protein [Candidatus Moranbacteria bacterium]|nr:ATP-binding protein [Candidatus Moranbacteria bacterium]
MFKIGKDKQKALPTDPIMQSQEIYQQGLATIKDLIAPSAVKISPSHIEIGDISARTIFVMAFPKFLNTNWFSPIINIDFPINISIFIHPMDTNDVLKDLQKTSTQVQSRINMEASSGKVRNPMLESAYQNVEELRTRLQEGTEKFFKTGIYLTAFGDSKEEVNSIIQEIEAILEAQLVYVKPADFRVEQGFLSTIPLGEDSLNASNSLNTSPLSTTFPFVSADLSSNQGILYGINRHNNSLVLFDRFAMENANMVVFAKSGAGKSYAIKLEVLRSLMMDTNVIIIDPENEYQHLCNTVGGSFIKISLNSKSHLNPFDIPKVGEGEDPADVLRNNIASIIGLLHIMLGSVTPEEDSVLDKAIHEVYSIRDISAQTNFNSLTPESFPTMSDLYEVLRNMEGSESLAARLERYTEGIFSGFINQPTNIITKGANLVVFNIRDLESELRPVAMYMVLQYIWNEMRSDLRKRMVVVDEAWVMMQHEDAASFLFGIAKRCRKYYTGLTTITQDINDFMSSRYGKPIVTNSSLQLLLKQSPAAIDTVVDTFYLTAQEKFLLLESNVGEGIFFAGNKHAAIKIIASYSEDQIITSDPRQLLEIEEAKKELEEEEDTGMF